MFCYVLTHVNRLQALLIKSPLMHFFSLPSKHRKPRVRTGPGNPGKSWNFVVTFSKTGKSWKNTAGPGKSWKSVKLNKVITFFLKQMSKIFKCYYNVCVFGVLEKTIWSLEKSWKSLGKLFLKKGTNPKSPRWRSKFWFQHESFFCWALQNGYYEGTLLNMMQNDAFLCIFIIPHFLRTLLHADTPLQTCSWFVYITSLRPCWWSRTKAFLFSGN